MTDVSEVVVTDTLSWLCLSGLRKQHEQERKDMRSSGWKLTRVAGAFAVAAALSVANAPSAYAASQSFDHTFTVAEETPSGFACVGAQCVELPGVEDVTLRIQATAVAAEGTNLSGTSGGTNCRKLDRMVRLVLDPGASGSLTISYTKVDPRSEAGTPAEPVVVPFVQGTNASAPDILLCLR